MSDSSTDNISSTSKALGFEFKGNGFEYFKIWIVNVLLSIITLGIYSAWATVRTHRYFYSNLYLDNSNFRYLAEPLAILKGRLIAVAVFVLLSVIVNVSPPLGIALYIGLIFAIPYFLNMSMAFNRRMSAYNNIQFRFKASYGEAFMAVIVWPILGILTLGILYPLALVKINRYAVKNSAYGTTKFDFSATYKDYGIIILTIIGAALLLALPAWALILYVPALAVISPLYLILVYLGIIVYATVQMTRVYYQCLSLAGHGFEANLTMGGYAKVVLINFFLTIITLGLYLPAAKVRMTKYIASCLTMHAVDSLNDFAAAEQENISALGEELGQVFDFSM